jgi:serine protease 16
MFVLSFLALRMRLEFPRDIPTSTFTNKIDHFTSTDNRTFQQRYYLNRQYAPSGLFSRALIYIGGEGDLANTSVLGGSMQTLAKNLSAPIFGLEHRFFGESQPFPPESGLATENLRYLTIEQALADLARFINETVVPRGTADLRIGVIGGSYPGSLSAWFRTKYPHIAAASWASSAPVLIKNNFTEYDAYIAQQVDTYPSCLTRVRAVFNVFHEAVSTQNVSAIDAIRAAYGFTSTEDNISMLYVLTDILAAIVQYNSRYRILQGLCADLTDDVNHNLIVYHNRSLQLLALGNETVEDFDLMSATSTDWRGPFRNSRSWSYMTCTQVGWFQTASGQLRSPFLNESYFTRVCEKLFNITSLPIEREINNAFGGIKPAATRVFYTNSGVDPWSTMGYHVDDQGNEQRAVLIPGESHCSDLGTVSPSDSPDLAKAKADVIAQMVTWLGAWNCSGKCGEHGRCLVDACVCQDGFQGKECEEETRPKADYNAALICAVSLPIVGVIVATIVAWLVCYRRGRVVRDWPKE